MRSLTGLNANPIELQVKIAVQWGSFAWSYYSTRKDGSWEPKIQSFSGLRSSVNSDGSANLTQTSVSLFDTGSGLQEVATRGEAEGSAAIVYVDDQEIFRGQVRNAVWSDKEQVYSFDIVSYIESKQIGYSVAKNIYTPNNEVVVGKPWPVCFGKPQHVPAVFSQSTPRGVLSRPVNLGANVFRDKYFTVTENEGEEDEKTYPLDEDIVDKTEASLEAMIKAPIEDGATVIKPVDFIYMSEQDYDKFDIPRDEEEFKVSVDGVIFRVETAGYFAEQGYALKVLEANAPKYENLACADRPARKEDDPDFRNPKVLWLSDAHTNINMVGNVAYVGYSHTGYLWDEEAKRERLQTVTRYYENPCVRQEGLKCWFKYPFFYNKTPGSKAAPRSQVDAITDDTHGLCRAGVTIAHVKGVSHTGLLIDLPEFITEMKEKLRQVQQPVDEESKFSALAEQLELVGYIKSAFWTAEEGANIVEWEPEEGDIYIANYFSSSEVTGVYAKRKIKDKEQLVAVPSTYYEIDLDRTANLEDGTTRQVTTIEFSRPLDTYRGQEWDASEIYVTLKSDAASGSSNPADIVEYILSNYSDYSLASFTAVGNSLSNLDMDFAITTVSDAYELSRQIAWQARCALVSDAGTVRMVNVALSGSPHHIFTEDNTYFQSIQVTQVNLDTLVTKNEGKWKKHYGEDERFTSWTVNQDKYGITLQNKDMFCFNVEQSANDTLQFWTHRSGISWKLVELEADPSAMNLEVYDIVRLNYTDFPNLFYDTGIVIAYNYDFINQKANFTIMTAVPAGETTGDSRFWFSRIGSAPKNPANESEIKNYSLVEENFNKTLEELIREIRKLEDTAKVFGKVTAIKGSTVTLDLYPFGPFNEKTKSRSAHDVNFHDGIKVGDWVEMKGGQDGINYVRRAPLPKIFGLVDFEDPDVPPSSNEYRIRIINFLNPFDVGFDDDTSDPSNFENHYVGSGEAPAEGSDDIIYADARCFNEMAKGQAAGRVPNFSVVELHWGVPKDGQDGFWYFHTNIEPKFDGVLSYGTRLTDNRWTYPFEQVRYTTRGLYSTVNGGITGIAYNKIEAGNTGDGIEGNGTNMITLPSGVAMVPIGAGAVVEIKPEYSCETGEVEYVFQATNIIDGECDTLA